MPARIDQQLARELLDKARAQGTDLIGLPGADCVWSKQAGPRGHLRPGLVAGENCSPVRPSRPSCSPCATRVIPLPAVRVSRHPHRAQRDNGSYPRGGARWGREPCCVEAASSGC